MSERRRQAPFLLAAYAPLAAAIAWSALGARGGLSTAGAAACEIGAGTTALVLAAAIALGRLPVPRLPRTAICAALALALYAGVAIWSESWALSPAAAHDEGLRLAGALCALGAGLCLPRIAGRPTSYVLAASAALGAVACLWAIVDRAVGGDRIVFTARLEGPLENPNVLAGVALPLVVAGGLLAVAERRRLRAAGLCLAGLAVFTTVLASSRAGLGLEALAGLALALRGSGPLVRLAPWLALAAPAGVGVWVSRWATFQGLIPHISEAGPALLGAALLASASAAVADRLLDTGLRRTGAVRARRVERALLAVVGVAVCVALGLLLTAGDAATRPGSNEHLVSVGANLRGHWWGTAWKAFTLEPWHGYGAGSFRIVEQLGGRPPSPTVGPHDLVLEALAGTGILGGLATALLVIAALAACATLLVRAELGAAALALLPACFLLHALIDVVWSATALQIAAMVALGVTLAPAGLAARALPGYVRPAVAATALCAALLGYAAAGPWRAVRTENRATVAADPAAVLAAARDAEQLDERRIEPLLTEASARQQLGDERGARGAVARAIALEPASYQGWLARGTYELGPWHDPAAALRSLERANLLAGGLPETRAALARARAASPPA